MKSRLYYFFNPLQGNPDQGIQTLPTDAIHAISQQLSLADINALAQTSKTMHQKVNETPLYSAKIKPMEKKLSDARNEFFKLKMRSTIAAPITFGVNFAAIFYGLLLRWNYDELLEKCGEKCAEIYKNQINTRQNLASIILILSLFPGILLAAETKKMTGLAKPKLKAAEDELKQFRSNLKNNPHS